jgi:hypothetical protein
VLRGFHATVFGITFGPVNAIFSGTGALAVVGGLYARFSLRELTPKGEPGHS